MSGIQQVIDAIALWALAVGVGITAVMAIAVFAERLSLVAHEARVRRLKQQYEPLIARALQADADAVDSLARSPRRYRIELARLLLFPLVDDRSPERIARTRAIIRAMSLDQVADDWLRSYRWWRRLVALQAFGLIQYADRTKEMVAALDDANADVRNAALDALADLQDPETLKVIVVHLHDPTLQRGRRAAAITAFGSQCEGFLLDLARVDPAHRLNYAKAIGICGTPRSLPSLCEWAADGRPPVSAAAFEALGRLGLDGRAASLAIGALESADVSVRTMAAGALSGWSGGADDAARMARHLDDAWPVAVRVAHALRTMGGPGRIALQAQSARPDLAGALARRMLWEAEARV